MNPLKSVALYRFGLQPVQYRPVVSFGLRYYAKSNKKHSHSNNNHSNKSTDDQQTPREFDFGKYQSKMQHCVEKFKEELARMRLGRANASILDGVRVSMGSGNTVKLNQIARVIVKDQQTLNVIVSDEQHLDAVDKAIRGANLNLNPQLKDQILRVPIPKMSQEYRDSMVKQVGQIAEQAKVKIRYHRQEARTDLKKHKLQSKEDDKRMEKTIQDVTEKSSRQIDELAKQKAKEISSS